MYDKFGLILRVETVINRPKEFWVYRTQRHRDGTSSLGYFPMNKNVASLIHYQEQALACNRRYLDALAVVDDPAPAYQELRQLTEPKVVAGRSYAGFNPARRDDVRLFAAVLDGDHIARGFRNADIREPLFGTLRSTSQQRRASAAVGRLLKRLHVRHLVAKIPRTRRWRVTEHGRHLLGVAVQLYRLLARTRGIVGCYCAENFSASCGEVQGKESNPPPPSCTGPFGRRTLDAWT